MTGRMRIPMSPPVQRVGAGGRACESVPSSPFWGEFGMLAPTVEWMQTAQNATGNAVAAQADAPARNFARHLRTKVHEEGGARSTDAVYTNSPTLPDRPAKNHVEIVRADCEQSAIPMV